jgi:bifunctional non-homologous end joining protein LigD
MMGRVSSGAKETNAQPFRPKTTISMTASPNDKLDVYRSKRRAGRTPEPLPSSQDAAVGEGDRFVVQEHRARALHWDVRLERAGVLVSWAVPKGLPLEPRVRRLAVQTEDHPLEYGRFEGDIPEGEYGSGSVTIWDRGRYECDKWSEDEVMVVLHGTRLQGRYVLIHTEGRNWIVQRMDAADEDRRPLPPLIRPMLATSGELPSPDAAWGFEFKWDGIRAVAYVDGGRMRLVSRNDRDVPVSYPELRHAAEDLGSISAVLDGEIVAFDDTGRPSFGTLQQRMHVTDPNRAHRLAEEIPAVYMVFDVLFLDGRSAVDLPYHQRRQRLEALGLGGPRINVPPSFEGGGAAVLQAARDQGLEGVVAKRLGSVYQPGRRSPDWVKVKHLRTREVVIGGWTPGRGRRRATMGALVLGRPGPDGLSYVGRVGTGFTDTMLVDLATVLRPLERPSSPFVGPLPREQAAGAQWVEARLVGEVSFSEWTTEKRLRQPVWRGLRSDKSPADVGPET